MKDSMSDIVMVCLGFLGIGLMIAGLLLHLGGSSMNTREIIIVGAVLTCGTVLYANYGGNENDDL